MRAFRRLGCLALLSALGGCVLAPPLPPPPAPLIALPGPGKTQAQFTADDASCRAAADATPIEGLAVSVQPTPGEPPPGKPPSGTSAAVPAPGSPGGQPQTILVTPGMVYLRCMTAHNDAIQPLAPIHPVFYGYYPAYPIYAGFGDYYPFLYGDWIGFGYWGGGWGFRGDGFRDGGFREGGFRGDGFRGGGFGGGGFRGGGGGGFRR